MRINYFLACIFFFALFVNTSAQTADDIITKHFNAAGINNLTEVKTIIINGKITGTGIKTGYIGYLVKKVRPYKQYMELKSGSEISKTIFDGRSEWAVSKGKTVKNPFDVEEQRKRKICFEGDLFYCRNNGYQFEYKGIGQIEGLDFHTIKVTNKDGFEAVYYFDPGSFMCMKSVEGDVETYFSNFKTEHGATLPYSIRVVIASTGQSTELNLDSIEFDKEIEESLFVK